MDVTGQGQSGGVGGGGWKIVYRGRRAVVLEEGEAGLVAYPREDPTLREAQYLSGMLNELLSVINELYEYTGHSLIVLRARVKRGGEWHAVAIKKRYGVLFVPLRRDYTEIIRKAEKVKLKMASKDLENSPGAYRGRFVVVVKGPDGHLHAYARSGTALERGPLMMFAIGEVIDKLKELKSLYDFGAVALHGLVWLKGVAYYPVIYSMFNVMFTMVDVDYEYFLRTAEEVRFTALSAPRR